MPSTPTPHADHDVLILAAAADHDPDPATLATVERMTAECPTCAAIAADLRFLASGLAALPPEVPAPRDFRITDVQAARLRRGGLVRRLLRPFGADGLPGLQPLAGALTVVGLAGILLTNIPLGLGGASSAALNTDRGAPTAAGPGEAAAPAPSDAAVEGPTKANSPQPPSVDQGTGSNAGASSVPAYGLDTPPASHPSVVAGPASGGAGYAGNAFDRSAGGGSPGLASPTIPPLTLASVAVLALGVVLLSLRLVARRID